MTPPSARGETPAADRDTSKSSRALVSSPTLVIFLSVLLPIASAGCGLMWGVEGGIAETYVQDNQSWARRLPTSHWIRELKRNQHYDRHKASMLFAHRDVELSRFELALAVLKERRAPEVLEAFREIGTHNPDHWVKVEMVRAIEAYYTDGIDATPALLDIYESVPPETFLRDSILKTCLDQKAAPSYLERLAEIERKTAYPLQHEETRDKRLNQLRTALNRPL